MRTRSSGPIWLTEGSRLDEVTPDELAAVTSVRNHSARPHVPLGDISGALRCGRVR
jgi:hypothetical protein